MADVIRPEDIKNVYQYALNHENCTVTVDDIANSELGLDKGNILRIFQKLVVNRTACQTAADNGFSQITVRSQDIALALRGLTNDDAYLLYCTVEQYGRIGVNSRDLPRIMSDNLKKKGLPAIQQINVNRALKYLENEKLVKMTRNIHFKGRRMVMLYHLEADESLVGGVFYKDGEFNFQLVNQFRSKIFDFISSHKMVTEDQLMHYVGSSDLSQKLGTSDIKRVVTTLILDLDIVSLKHPVSGEPAYMNSTWINFEEAERLPCASCELQNSCHVEDVDRNDILKLRRNVAGRNLKFQPVAVMDINQTNKVMSQLTSKITPAQCPYLSQWLNLKSEPWVPPVDYQQLSK